ncbi:MAG: hypothetical protein CMH83_21020 [Nocardioides sp.]|nr:hypothetical protein [Nocardioides sp.]
MGTENDQQGAGTPDGSTPPEGAQGAPGEPSGTDQAETFSREYVEKLRSENAEQRTKAKRAEDAETRLRDLAVAAAVRGILTDPTDLGWSDEYADEDGWPDAEKITAAAEALVERKPHLARPSGDVGQGRHSDTDEPVSLVGLLQAGA